MRFWNTRQAASSGRVRPTQPHQRQHKQFNNETLRHRRSFGSTLGDPEPEEKIPSIESMDIPTTQPTDKSRTGVDRTPRSNIGTSFPPYDITNLNTDRTYDADLTSTGELADVLGTLIRDVQRTLAEILRRINNA